MNSNKKYLIIGIVSILLLMLGVSVAYFTTEILGEGKRMIISTANLEIIFTDKSEIIEEEITPGWSKTKEFTVENRSNDTFKYNISMKDFINTFALEYLEYKITSTNGYNMTEYEVLPKSEETSTVTLKEGISIEVGETHTYTINFRYRDDENVNQAEDMNKTFEGTLSIEEYEQPRLYSKLLEDNLTILTRTDFSTVFTEENTGTLYKTSGNETEDGSEVYYFAGNALNNWVKFGKDQEDNELYWRIIRTNEDGSIRLLYVGPDKATESAFISIDGTYMAGGSNITGMYNNTYNNTMYVGYMYGSEGSLASNRGNTTSAPIKTVTDSWYSKTLNIRADESGNTYDKYVSRTAIYCNDRSGDGWASSDEMYYAAYNRLIYANEPSYKCGNNASRSLFSDANVADKFSSSTTKGGNGLLEYPIAQITADEIAYAGGVYDTNSQAWYYYNSAGGSTVGSGMWWTMSPSFADGDNNASVFSVYGSGDPGYLDYWYVVGYTAPGVRPVLSLKSCVKYVSGNGSSATPYEVSIDSTCTSLEN